MYCICRIFPIPFPFSAHFAKQPLAQSVLDRIRPGIALTEAPKLDMEMDMEMEMEMDMDTDSRHRFVRQMTIAVQATQLCPPVCLV